MRKIDRAGEIGYNNQGLKMIIIEYKNKRNIDIQFEDGTIIKNREYKSFKLGNIKNPYFPQIYNIGFIGKGKYKPSENRKDTEEYTHWVNILKRCYDEKTYIKRPNYKDCIVCEEWYNFQNFAEWYNNNKWDDNIKFQVDKDIIYKNNKIYSPKTCVLVDNVINCLFTKRQNDRGKYPIGVYYNKEKKRFVSQCSINTGIPKHLGYYDTPEEAFLAYKEFKESYIKKVADEYKSKYPQFPQRLYDAMYSYQVEITD